MYFVYSNIELLRIRMYNRMDIRIHSMFLLLLYIKVYFVCVFFMYCFVSSVLVLRYKIGMETDCDIGTMKPISPTIDDWMFYYCGVSL